MSVLTTDLVISSSRLLRACQDLKAAIPATLYNGKRSGKRVGWALIARPSDGPVYEGQIRVSGVSDIHGRRFSSYGSEVDFSEPTEAYSGFFQEILDSLAGRLGKLYRARIIRLQGRRQIHEHHDGHDRIRFYRYHIPIIPNEFCTFTVASCECVMGEAGRLYYFPGWERHGVLNEKGERVHLIFSAYEPFLPQDAAALSHLR